MNIDAISLALSIKHVRLSIIIYYLLDECDRLINCKSYRIFLVNKLFKSDMTTLFQGYRVNNGFYVMWNTEVNLNRHFWTAINQCRAIRLNKARLMIDYYASDDANIESVLARVRSKAYNPGESCNDWHPYN